MRTKTSGFEILGAPIGPKGFCENYVRTSVFTDLKKGIAAVSRIEDPQVALHILRSCLSFGKLVHVLRSVPPSFLDNICNEYNSIIRGAFSTITGIYPNADNMIQFSRSVSRGGLGFRDPSSFAFIAYFASAVNASVLDDFPLSDVEDITVTISFINDNVLKPGEAPYNTTTQYVIESKGKTSQVSPHDEKNHRELKNDYSEVKMAPTQHSLSHDVEDIQFDYVLKHA